MQSLMADYLGNKKCQALIIHHTHNWSDKAIKEIIKIANNKSVQKILYCHDFHFVCGEPHLRFNGGHYCGILTQSINERRCGQCHYGGVAMLKWQEHMAVLLRMMDVIVVPSVVVAKALATFYPPEVLRDAVVVQGHLAMEPMLPTTPLPLTNLSAKYRLAFLGSPAEHKGWSVFQHMVANPTLQKKYDFFHFGGNPEKNYNPLIQRISYDTRNDPNILVRLLQEYHIDLAFLWSVVPESYSYTLHEAVAAGVPVLTGLSSGNIATQIIANPVYGKTFASIEILQDFLLNEHAVTALLKARSQEYKSLRHHSFLLERLRGA
jgi:hypothetical protein